MTIGCKINGSTVNLSTSWSVDQQSGAVSSSSIDVEVPAGSTPPRPWSRVVLYADDVPFFLGFVTSVSSPEYSSGYESRVYRLAVNSAECLFNNRLVSESLDDMTTTEIVQYLFDNYIAAENITLGAISTITYEYDNYACQYQRLYDTLADLAEDNDATFFISPDGKFYFLTRGDYTQIPAPEHIAELAIESENGDLRTVQIVSGASEETSSTTEHVYWTTDLGAYVLGYSVKSITGITINGVTAGVGLLGVDEADTTKTFLYEVGSNTITLNQSAATKPASGNLVVTVYKGIYDIDVIESNESLTAELAAMNGTSGIIESQYSDETLNAYATADAKALSLLGAYGDYEDTVSCLWRGDTLEESALGMMWLFDESALNIEGQFCVVGRTINSFGADKLSIKITLKNKNFFLRYGTTLIDTAKQPTENIKVYKNMSLTDTAAASDAFVIDIGDYISYPTDGASLSDPGLSDTFYPGVY